MKKLVRRHDWRSRLYTWAEQQVGRPFVWGQTDCGALARQALEQMFGEDVLAQLPRWESPREAMTVLKAHVSMGGILERLGAERNAPAFVRAGDLIVTQEPGEEEVHRESVVISVDGRQCLACNRDGVQWLNLSPDAPAVAYSLWEVTVRG